MREIGQYVVTLTCVALVCGLVPSLLRDGAAKTITRLVCGVFLTVTALGPLTDLELPNLERWSAEYESEGRAAAARGEALAQTEKSIFIKEGLEAYILDKAARLGADIQVQVTLDADGLPAKIQISGEPSEESRRMLTQIIQTDLGIPKEKQQWTG